MKEKVIEFMSFVLIMLLFLLMLLSSIRITYLSFSLKDYSSHLIIIGGLGFFLYFISKIKNFKFNKFEIMIFFLMFLSSLSLIHAINRNEALFGRYGRYEGLFVILTYYILTLIGMNIKNKKFFKIIIFSILSIGFANLFYGLFQVGIFKFSFFLPKKAWVYASGFLGNSSFFASLMAICYPLILGIFIKTDTLLKKIISYLLVLIFSLGIIISGAMSAYVACFFTFIFIFIESISLILKKNKDGINHLIFLFFSFVSFILIFFLVYLNNSTLKNDTLEIFQEADNLSHGRVQDDYGTGRIYIWKNTIIKIKENYLTGVGIDNFFNAFTPPLIDFKSLSPVDKAHNDYLQKMLCEGVFSGSLFIIFLLTIFFCSFFKKKDSTFFGFYLAFISYSIQAFFNISVTRVAPFYFIIIGLLISLMDTKKTIREEKKNG